ncbi:hypothetical protein [Macellibacteroides fermentans]|uniref:hypothetical protein n=1 Tax=Macellibacteroides fermentans TaxID=879969 RepID=UPI00406C0379
MTYHYKINVNHTGNITLEDFNDIKMLSNKNGPTIQSRQTWTATRAADLNRSTFQIVIHAITAFQKHLLVGVTNVPADFVIFKNKKLIFIKYFI